MDYDAWVLRGPGERDDPIMETCETCKGTGLFIDPDGLYSCEECDGIGEIEVTLDEPDDDYEFERRRDATWEDRI